MAEGFIKKTFSNLTRSNSLLEKQKKDHDEAFKILDAIGPDKETSDDETFETNLINSEDVSIMDENSAEVKT